MSSVDNNVQQAMDKHYCICGSMKKRINILDIEQVKCFSGDTALHIVSKSTKIEPLTTAKLLIQARAHVDCLNKCNKTPFDCAATLEMKS